MQPFDTGQLILSQSLRLLGRFHFFLLLLLLLLLLLFLQPLTLQGLLVLFPWRLHPPLICRDIRLLGGRTLGENLVLALLHLLSHFLSQVLLHLILVGIFRGLDDTSIG
mmetsp:Transcript_31410/g.30757  ORF Transcript_31410/g.30757 Transcript_31410/m.30757 type:complete len:109 (-) Transcript_31410:105-431(-)